MKKSEIIIKILFFVLVLYMPLFRHLDTLVIRTWDEARLANNAYEMLQNGNFIVTYCDGKPDMWNTKPPLMIWIQVLFMKIIGVNELAVRLPSALAALFTCAIIVLFFIKTLNSYVLGIISILVLVTTGNNGYVDLHGTRTGDYDALLTLFTTSYALCFFIYLENKRAYYLYAFFILLTLAIFTKGIAGILLLPALFIYTIYKNQLLENLKNYKIYLPALISLFLVVGYYFIRESLNPGYIEAVKMNELGGRFNNALEGHKEPFEFYFLNITNTYFKAWYFFIPLGIAITFYTKNIILRQVGIFSLMCSITHLLIISTAETKLTWYAMPSFPFIAILIALFINYLYNFILKIESEFLHQIKTPLLGISFLILLFIVPYRDLLNRTYLPKESGWDKDDYHIGYYLRDAIKGKLQVNNYYYVRHKYDIQNLFYINILNNIGVNIKTKYINKVQNNDTLIVYQDRIKKHIESNYSYKIINSYKNVVIYKIIACK